MLRLTSPYGLVCCVVGFLAGCAATQAERQWRVEIDRADQLADARRYEEALEAYQSLVEQAPGPLERRYLIYRLGYIEERREHFPAAIAHYTRLLDDWQLFAQEDEYTPRGLFRLGLILYDHLGQQEQALKVWRQVIAFYPNVDGPAHRALDAILVHYEQNGLPEQAVRFLADSYPPLSQTRLADNLLYWLGYWYRHHLGDLEQAFELFRRVRTEFFDTSSLRDDAEWEMVEILHEWGNYGQELTLLREMAREREFNLFFGSDATTSMEKAAFRIGIVYQDSLGDYRQAIREFQGFLDGWEFSLYRDDAAFRMIQSAIGMDDLPTAAQMAHRFLEEFDESRHVEEVQAMLVDQIEVDR
ncbi:MAG: tetratricopeptide repeat protein [Bradymonadales bacterium]|nr:tetratricopeptide repeat protein [Bradymonadales bacterium]